MEAEGHSFHPVRPFDDIHESVYSYRIEWLDWDSLSRRELFQMGDEDLPSVIGRESVSSDHPKL